MEYKRKIPKTFMCPLEYGLDIFGGKWKPRIICVLSLSDGTRYSDLKAELDDITDTVLTAMLKELRKENLVSRTAYDEMPPKVVYSLTDKGRSILPILQAICFWSRSHTSDLLEKRLTPCKNCPI
jgi:DNA-binding HxlR family transcriptional regulator